jgi:nucleoside-diphosphate-sugar epimerase
MNISVIGCGWLGLAVAKLLVKQGHTVTGTYRSEKSVEVLQQEGVKPFLFDTSLSDSNNWLLPESNAFLIALPPRFRAGSSSHIQDLEQILNNTPASTHVVYCSSTSVYEQLEGEVNEQTEVSAQNNMRQAELKVLEMHGNATLVRLGGLMGPDRYLAKYLSGKEVANGTQAVNHIHQTDAAAILAALLVQNGTGEIFNAVALKHPNRKEVATASCIKHGLALPTFTNTDPSPGRSVSGQKILDKLQYQLKFPDPCLF